MYENLNNGLIFKETIVFLNLNHRPLMNSIMYYRRTDWSVEFPIIHTDL